MDAVNLLIVKMKQLQDYYNWMLSFADPRVEGWLFMSSPLPTIFFIVLYFIMIRKTPKFMKQRKPMNLNHLLVVYNLLIASLNFYITWEIASAIWWYYVSKLIELCDTLFFMIRKKENQLSFLHVYHHSTMFVAWWIGVKWMAAGSTFLVVAMNSFIHILTYTYYGLSSLGSDMQKYLWWKRHLTILQMIQFFLYFALSLRAALVGCSFPMWMMIGLILYSLSLLILFGNFYRRTYLKKTCRSATASNGHLCKVD